MRFASCIWKLLHVIAALAALHVSEFLAAHSGMYPGLLAGAAAGFLIETLMAAAPDRAIPQGGRAVFLGSSIALTAWYAVSPGYLLGPFKLAWLIAALLTAYLLAGSFAHGSHRRRRAFRNPDSLRFRG
ncbi:MAG: hypothetical protein Q7T82_05225 [Armatimonadota bacterium]|nr:hypothetical protein [Armatimonadota bacterium]